MGFKVWHLLLRKPFSVSLKTSSGILLEYVDLIRLLLNFFISFFLLFSGCAPSGRVVCVQEHAERGFTSVRINPAPLASDDLDSMTSAERISFLQDKLQEIRKYYMSLKSEVASIDRRRKRLKKKEREGEHCMLGFVRQSWFAGPGTALTCGVSLQFQTRQCRPRLAPQTPAWVRPLPHLLRMLSL